MPLSLREGVWDQKLPHFPLAGFFLAYPFKLLFSSKWGKRSMAPGPKLNRCSLLNCRIFHVGVRLRPEGKTHLLGAVCPGLINPTPQHVQRCSALLAVQPLVEAGCRALQ